jgi:hypothetical protein
MTALEGVGSGVLFRAIPRGCPRAERSGFTPSIANFKPQPAWRSIRQWLEGMQLVRPA